MPKIELIQGDCLEKMKDIPDGSIDCIITSPPYAIGKKYDESVNLEDFIYVASTKLKINGVFVFQVGNRIKEEFVYPIDILTFPFFEKVGLKLVNRVIWHFGHGLHCSKRLSGRYETICIYAKNKQHVFNLDAVRVPQKYPNKKYYKGEKKGSLSCNPLGKNPSDVWEISNVKYNHPEKVEHPCQFPEDMITRIVACFTNKFDTVMDPFMGSGTTGVACKNLNRNFIGIELDPEYFKIAEKRINENL
jgi:adenine-specific DNA-methyltransferase